MDPPRSAKADLLVDCSERNVGLSLPGPLSERVDHLVDCVEAEGERTSRKELIASLILSAEFDGPQLAAGVRRLRSASTSDPEEHVPYQGRRQPGPRPRRRTTQPRSAD
jgi:hypothetical protein